MLGVLVIPTVSTIVGALAFLLLLLVMIRTIRPRIANRSPNPIRRGSDWPLG